MKKILNKVYSGMRKCPNCSKHTYQKWYDYYGHITMITCNGCDYLFKDFHLKFGLKKTEVDDKGCVVWIKKLPKCEYRKRGFTGNGIGGAIKVWECTHPKAYYCLSAHNVNCLCIMDAGKCPMKLRRRYK